MKIKRVPDGNVVKTTIIISVAMNFLFFIYGVLEMYYINKADFTFGADKVLQVIIPLFLVGAVCSIIAFGIAWIINEKFYSVCFAAYVIAYFVTYIQGTFLVNDLPVLNGEEIDWNSMMAGRIKSIAAVIAVSFIVILLYKRTKRDSFLFAIRFICCVMIAMFTVTIFTLHIQSKKYADEEVCVTFDHQYEFSNDKNFIILVLDAVSSEGADLVLSENEEYREMFDGFTFYRNTVGSYPTTAYALSYLFSGRWYEGGDFEEYRRNAYTDSPLFDYFEANDYRLGMYTTEVPSVRSLADRFENVYNVKRQMTYFRGAASCMIKLAGYRYALFDLKRFCNFNLSICYQFFTVKGYAPYVLENEVLYQSMSENGILKDSPKWFKFIHLEGAHVPWYLNKDVESDDNADYKSSIEASFTVTDKFLYKLKEFGIYDNSVIIAMADHGYNSGLEEDDVTRNHMPFLCVKGLSEHHELNISDAPISAEDFIEAFEKMEQGAKSTEAFNYKEGDERKRRFILYNGHWVEYEQTGHVFDIENFKPTGVVFD